MNKKKWVDRLTSIKKLKGEAEFNKAKAEEDIEELNFMIEALQKKVKSIN